jgi:hypothetical protein
MMQDDYVVYLDHRGRFRVDRITSPQGHHLTLGSTRGEASLKDAIEIAERDAHQVGAETSAVFISRRNDYSQIGNMVRGRYQESG